MAVNSTTPPQHTPTLKEFLTALLPFLLFLLSPFFASSLHSCFSLSSPLHFGTQRKLEGMYVVVKLLRSLTLLWGAGTPG